MKTSEQLRLEVTRANARKLTDALSQQLHAFKIDGFEPEVRFHETRRWRFDFAHKALRIALECEGGIWTTGAHVRGKHFESDCEKYNAAALLGWCVLRFSGNMIKSGAALQTIERAVAARRALK